MLAIGKTLVYDHKNSCLDRRKWLRSRQLTCKVEDRVVYIVFITNNTNRICLQPQSIQFTVYQPKQIQQQNSLTSTLTRMSGAGETVQVQVGEGSNPPPRNKGGRPRVAPSPPEPQVHIIMDKLWEEGEPPLALLEDLKGSAVGAVEGAPEFFLEDPVPQMIKRRGWKGMSSPAGNRHLATVDLKLIKSAVCYLAVTLGVAEPSWLPFNVENIETASKYGSPTGDKIPMVLMVSQNRVKNMLLKRYFAYRVLRLE